MIIKEITFSDLDLCVFISLVMGKSKRTFRYFNTRPQRVIEQHQVTLLGYLETTPHYGHSETPIAYGHLDPSDGKVWLGICVGEDYCGQGHGAIMLKELIDRATTDLYLSVDLDNERARAMYEKSGFNLESTTDSVAYYRLEK